MKRFLVLVVLGVLIASSCGDSERVEELETEVTRLRVEMLVSQKALSESFDRTSESVDELESTKTELEEALRQVAALEKAPDLRQKERPVVENTLAFQSSGLSDIESLNYVKFDPFSLEEEGEWVEVETENGMVEEFQGRCVYVNDFLVAEIVDESPGPEVLVSLNISGCGSGRGHGVQMFAGNTSEPVPIGNRFGGFLFRVDDDNEVIVGDRSWSEYWVNCCPDQWDVSKYHWVDGKWERKWNEVWTIEESTLETKEEREERVINLVERVGIRGSKAIAPKGWAYTYIDGGGSGSQSYWKNGWNSLEEVGLVTGASFGTWLGLDGVEGSVDPTGNIISDWGDDVVVEKIDDRTFNFTRDTTNETFNYSHVSTNGVWVAHLGKDGSCCVAFTEAWITLEGLSEVHKEVIKEFREYVVSNIS